MNESEARPDWTVLSRVSADFESLSRQMAQMSTHLTEMQSTLTAPRPQAAPPPPPQWTPPAPGRPPMHHMPMHPNPYPPAAYPPAPRYPMYPPPPVTPRPTMLSRAASAADGRLVGAVLAAAGVAVTLIGVVLLLVLAAQAGILRPEVRVAAGVVLAGALVAFGCRMHRRAEGRIGAIALAATGIAAAYLDIIAVTRIYEWLPPTAGLASAAIVGGAGLALARRWDAQALALGVVAPLIVLAPVVAGGIDIALIGFMLALSAVAFPAQLGTDWLHLHVVRVVAGTIWLVPATALSVGANGTEIWLLTMACVVDAALTLATTIAVLPRLNPVAVAVTSVIGVVPVLVCGVAVDRHLAAGVIGVLAMTLLGLVLASDAIPSMTAPVRHTWACLAGVAGLISIVSASDAPVAVPALLGLAATITVLGRHDAVGRWIGLAFAVIGAMAFAAQVPVSALVDATRTSTTPASSTIISGLLLAATAALTAWAWLRAKPASSTMQWLWPLTGLVALYAITSVCVISGSAIGGTTAGFLGGHMAATICWVSAAAAALVHATRVPAGSARVVPIGAGMTLAAAAVGKLILFDLATLDGAFRVGAFIVVGLILLTIGARYARVLGRDADATTVPASS